MSGARSEMSPGPISDTHMLAGKLAMAQTFGRVRNDFELTCWFEAVAKLFCEIIRRLKALGSASNLQTATAAQSVSEPV